MRFPRTIRLDGSDQHVFETAAEPGELAVPGAFAFTHLEEDTITGKRRQAFSNGFLGLTSFGRSTLAAVAEITDEEFEAAVHALAVHFVDHYGAPDLAAALPAARDEAAFAAGLCDHPPNTLLTVSRSFDEDGIIERFGTVEQPASGAVTRVWELMEDENGAD